MVRTTTQTTTESITTAEAAADLVEGDVVTVEYESNRSDTTTTFDAEVTNVDVTPATGTDFFGWVDVDLCRTVTDSGDDLADDDFPRRRLSVDPGDDFTVDARATTINGAEWRRISAIAGTVTVTTEVEVDEPEADDDDHDDRFAFDGEDDAIEAEARDVLGDEHVDDVLATYDDRYDAIVDLADAVADEEDARHGADDRDPFDMTPTDAEIAEAFGVDDVDDITDDMLEDVDVPDVPDAVDVSDYSTAAGAAKKTAEVIREHADAMGFDPDAVNLYRPEDAYQGYDAWAVVWEGGPYEWAVALTGGESLTSGEGPGFGGGDPEVEGLTRADDFGVECHFSFDLVFFDR